MTAAPAALEDLHQRLSMLQREMAEATLYSRAAVAALSALSDRAADAADAVLRAAADPQPSETQIDLFDPAALPALATPQTRPAQALEPGVVDAADQL
ncbi:MAG: hypothetical protein LPK04_06220, partial [Caulobacteraceae bacterium]|nr:hypothetical protein [Caulobacteraceae bacterium]